MALEAVPVRIRGDIVAGVGCAVRGLPDDFPARVEKRLREVIDAATDGYVRVYITVEQAPDAPPTRLEDV